MYLKTNTDILSLSVGNIHIGYSFKGWRVFYTTNLSDDSTFVILYEGTKEKCEKYLEITWNEMRQEGPDAFINTNNLYYKSLIEEDEND